jgi:hypothetical protein
LARKIRGDDGVISWVAAHVGSYFNNIDTRVRNVATLYLDLFSHFFDNMWLGFNDYRNIKNWYKNLAEIAKKRGSPEVEK